MIQLNRLTKWKKAKERSR